MKRPTREGSRSKSPTTRPSSMGQQVRRDPREPASRAIGGVGAPKSLWRRHPPDARLACQPGQHPWPACAAPNEANPRSCRRPCLRSPETQRHIHAARTHDDDARKRLVWPGRKVAAHWARAGCPVHGSNSNQQAVFVSPSSNTHWDLERLQPEAPSFDHHDVDIRGREPPQETGGLPTLREWTDGTTRQVSGLVSITCG